MKTALSAIALSPALVWLAPAGQAPAVDKTPQIAYVSTQRISVESPEAKATLARLPALQQEKATALRAKQQLLETTRRQLAQATDAATRSQLQQQEAQKRTDLERSTLQAQVDMQTLQRQLNADLQNRVKAAVEQVVKGQNVLVLNEAAVLWAGSTTDLTSAVIERLNAK
jgi:Skp family chaperone for outer membrane proteins